MGEMVALMESLAATDGFNQTALQGVKIFKASAYRPRQPVCYEQGVIIVGQGAKRVYLGGEVYEYNPENYLVLATPLPVECETRASCDSPFLALLADIEMETLHRIIGQMDRPAAPSLPGQKAVPHGLYRGLFLAQTTKEISDATVRLLRALRSGIETRVIGRAIVRELVFRIMCGENAAALYALASKNTPLSRVDRALRQIHENYQAPMRVDALAGLVNMSPSAFHKAFKEVTASSPIQYLKRIRLDRARTLLMTQGVRVNEAATQVGYESASQFSREFKRYFGMPPVSCNSPLRYPPGRGRTGTGTHSPNPVQTGGRSHPGS